MQIFLKTNLNNNLTPDVNRKNYLQTEYKTVTMKTDNKQTVVTFYKEESGQILAVFPNEKFSNGTDKVTCYAHVGQHSGVDPEYLVDYCKPCEKASEYKDLKNELESLGYSLTITNKVNVIKQTSAKQKKIDQALKVLREHGYLVQALWNSIDVDTICEEEDFNKLTPEQVVSFFDQVGQEHNAESGINWESLRESLKSFLNEEL